MTPDDIKTLVAAMQPPPPPPRGQISFDGILKFWPILLALAGLTIFLWRLSSDMATRDLKVDVRIERLEKSVPSPDKIQNQDNRINNLEKAVDDVNKKLTRIEDGVSTLTAIVKDVQAEQYSSSRGDRNRSR
jgi:peptidoglycan hydrolase CwlO-like protein